MIALSRSKLKSNLILGTYIVLMVVAAILFTKYVDQESLQNTVQEGGQLGILIYALIEIVYVTFTPLLNTFILIASGYIFGGHVGFVINFIATTFGLLLILFLVKKYGRSLLQNVVSENFYKKFDVIVQKVGPVMLLVAYVLPFTPDDELTYIVAAGPIGFKRFILPVLLGTAAKSAYSYIGALGTEGITIAIWFRVIILIVGVILVGMQEYLVKRKIIENKEIK